MCEKRQKFLYDEAEAMKETPRFQCIDPVMSIEHLHTRTVLILH